MSVEPVALKQTEAAVPEGWKELSLEEGVGPPLGQSEAADQVDQARGQPEVVDPVEAERGQPGAVDPYRRDSDSWGRRDEMGSRVLAR